jgi:Tat protein translocase TatC
VFAGDVAIEPLRKRIEGAFEEVAGELGASAEDQRLAASFRHLGSKLSPVLVEEFASGFAVDDLATIPQRFERLEKQLKAAEVTAGPSDLQKAIGWGADIRGVTQPIHDFVEFLKLRRAEVLKNPVSIPVLRRLEEETNLPRALDETLVTLERSARDIAQGVAKAPMVISYMESFASYLKVSLIFGILLTLPLILYEAWKFVGAGLYAHEQRFVITLLPMSLVLFAAGAVFGYFGLIPVGLEFLAGWGIEDVDINITLGSYIGLFFTLTLILGLVFQTPLVMIFLAQIGILDVETYRKRRRAAIFIGVCLSVVLTPPDPFSWSLMAAPMLLLYEVGIWCCDLIDRRKRLPARATKEASP